MKKVLLFAAALSMTCMMQAKTITLNVAEPLNPEAIEYDEAGVWAETYNEEDYATIDYQSMSFSHAAWTDWNFWYGFTIAKCQDTTYAEMNDQFHCVAGGGLAGKGTPYLLAYAAEGMSAEPPCEVFFDDACLPKEVSLCIGSWALHNVTIGGAGHIFAAGDSLVIEIQGLDDEYEVIEDKKVIFFLADYRSENEADWTLNNGWEKCDLSALGEVYGLTFTMKTSDTGDWGSNTALYFALDGLKIQTPAAVATFENEEGGINLTTPESNWYGADEPVEYDWNAWKSGDFTFQTYYEAYYKSSFVVTNETSTEFVDYNDANRSVSGGAYEGDNYVVWNMCYYGNDTVTFEKQAVKGFFVNNNVYAANSMCNGDGFAKKFGKDDWFKLTCIGVVDGQEAARVDVYLAAEGKYIAEWTYVDLTELGEVEGVTFTMSSSDSGDYGMNTPAYFAMDNFGAVMPEGYVAPEMKEFELDPRAISNTEAAEKAMKVVRNGQVVILRGDKAFNVLGAEL